MSWQKLWKVTQVSASHAAIASEYSVEVVNVGRVGELQRVGFWNPTDKLLWTQTKIVFPGGRLVHTDRISTLRGATVRLTVLPKKPYLWMSKQASLDSAGKLTAGSAQGFLPSLLKRLSDDLGFVYTLELPEGVKIGDPEPTQEQATAIIKAAVKADKVSLKYSC